MGIDDLDYKQREALREEAEKSRRNFNSVRGEILIQSGAFPEEKRQELESYLNEYDREFLQTMQDRKLLGVLEEAAFRTALSSALAPDEQLDSPEFIAASEQLAGAALADQSNYQVLRPDPVFAKDEISRLRTAVLLARQFRGEGSPMADLRQGISESLAWEYLDRGLTIPPALRDKLSVDLIAGMEAWSRLVGDTEGEVLQDAARRQLEDSGVHPKIAERIVKVQMERKRAGQMAGELTDYQKIMQANLDIFLREYPDTDELLSKILNLKDGKLPV